MSNNKGSIWFVVIFVLIAIVFAGLSMAGKKFDPPAAWLIAWTGWIGTVVVVISGARLLWFGADAAKKFTGK